MAFPGSISTSKEQSIPCKTSSWLMCSNNHAPYSIDRSHPKLFQIPKSHKNILSMTAYFIIYSERLKVKLTIALVHQRITSSCTFYHRIKVKNTSLRSSLSMRFTNVSWIAKKTLRNNIKFSSYFDIQRALWRLMKLLKHWHFLFSPNKDSWLTKNRLNSLKSYNGLLKMKQEVIENQS